MFSVDRLWFVVPVVFLLMSLLPLPYGYYQFMRIVVCIAASYIAFRAFSCNQKGWGIAFGMIAILFNPIMPVHLSRGVWAPIDIAAAVLFFVAKRTQPRTVERDD